MPDQYERCGNCGDAPVVARCIDAFGGPHTHPRSIHDLTDEYCTLHTETDGSDEPKEWP